MKPVQVYEGSGQLPRAGQDRVAVKVYTPDGASYTTAEIGREAFDTLRDYMENGNKNSTTVILYTPHARYLAESAVLVGFEEHEDGSITADLNISTYEEMDAPASPSV